MRMRHSLSTHCVVRVIRIILRHSRHSRLRVSRSFASFAPTRSGELGVPRRGARRPTPLHHDQLKSSDNPSASLMWVMAVALLRVEGEHFEFSRSRFSGGIVMWCW